MSAKNIILVTGASSGIGKEVSKKLCKEGYEVILTSRTKSYSDIDLTFTPKASGDIFKKQHGAAVKQAVKNLLLTNELLYP